jgi:3-hydroxyisobutyrate dehydrogenase
MSMQIAWIGLGNMGHPMAANLVAAGHQVTGFDVVPAARDAAAGDGVRIAETAAAAVADAQVVFTMLPSGSLVRRVLIDDGVLDACPPDATVIDSSTIDIADAREFSELVTGSGRRFLDAPVSGGVSGATAGTLTFMVGGDEHVLAAVRDVIEVMASRIFHTGVSGTGQAAKIVNNMMLGINLAGLCEGVTLAQRLGLDPTTFHDLVSVSSGDSWALRTWYPVPGVVDTAAVNRDFQGGFMTDLLAKDLGLALRAGELTKTPLPHAQAVAQVMDDLSAAGYGRRDCTILVRHVDGAL